MGFCGLLQGWSYLFTICIIPSDAFKLQALISAMYDENFGNHIDLTDFVSFLVNTEGPMSHDQPTYASVPGIRVYGMMCVQVNNRRGRHLRFERSSTRKL
jgi:hypothetical protein